MTIDDAAIERLVTEAQQGDAWAFGMIFDHYHESIYRFIASRVHRPSDAEDRRRSASRALISRWS